MPTLAGHHKLHFLRHVVLDHSGTGTMRFHYIAFNGSCFHCELLKAISAVINDFYRSFSPVKGNDVSQQQAPLVVRKFAVEEKVLSAQEVCKN